MKRAPRRTASTRSTRTPRIRLCERCGANLSVELIAVHLETPDGSRVLCAGCTRWTIDALDAAQELAGEMCEALWRAGEAEER